MILTLNSAIRSKTTYKAPVLFGEPQYDKCDLFSYSIYEKQLISEVRFSEREVIKHYFDSKNCLIKIEVYNHTNQLIKATRFEVRDISESGEIVFEDWTNGGKSPNIGMLLYVKSQNIWNLSFHRRYSFLGYRIQAKMELGKQGVVEKETYWTFDQPNKLHVLQNVFNNLYEMVDKPIENLAIEILKNGWKGFNVLPHKKLQIKS